MASLSVSRWIQDELEHLLWWFNIILVHVRQLLQMRCTVILENQHLRMKWDSLLLPLHIEHGVPYSLPEVLLLWIGHIWVSMWVAALVTVRLSLYQMFHTGWTFWSQL